MYTCILDSTFFLIFSAERKDNVKAFAQCKIFLFIDQSFSFWYWKKEGPVKNILLKVQSQNICRKFQQTGDQTRPGAGCEVWGFPPIQA